MIRPWVLGVAAMRRDGRCEGGGIHRDACQCGLPSYKLSAGPPPERRLKAAFDLPHSEAAGEVSHCDVIT